MEMRDVCSRAMGALSDQGAETGEIASPPLFAELTEAQKIVMSYEAARGWGDRIALRVRAPAATATSAAVVVRLRKMLMELNPPACE